MLSLVKEPLTPHWDNWQTWNKNKRCAVESEADVGIYLEELEAYTSKVSDCRSHLNSAQAPPLKRVHPAGSRGMLCCASTHSGVSGFQGDHPKSWSSSSVFHYLFSGKPALTSMGRCLRWEVTNTTNHQATSIYTPTVQLKCSCFWILNKKTSGLYFPHLQDCFCTLA